MHGKNKIVLRGRSTNSVKSRHPVPIEVNVPRVTLEKIGTTRVHADIVHVNDNTFLHATSDQVRLRTTSHLISRAKSTVLERLLKVVNMHKRRGFEVRCLDADMKFECVENDIDGATVDIVAIDDHENVIERSIRTVKERIRHMVQHAL